MPDDDEPQRKPARTIFEKIEVVKWLSFYPAIPAMMMVRSRIGYRTISPNMLVVLTLLMIVGRIMMPFQDNRWPVILFGLAFFINGHVQRFIRWRELRHGARWHTRSYGISWLEYIPLPPALSFLYNERRIYRFLDPLACFLVALIVMGLGSTSLCSFIAVSSMSLALHEMAYYEHCLNHVLDIHDELIDAEFQKDIAAHYASKPDAVPMPLEETGGIPSGLGRDIEAKVEERKRQAAERKGRPEVIALPTAPLATG